jgi:hypothetical protein
MDYLPAGLVEAELDMQVVLILVKVIIPEVLAAAAYLIKGAVQEQQIQAEAAVAAVQMAEGLVDLE